MLLYNKGRYYRASSMEFPTNFCFSLFMANILSVNDLVCNKVANRTYFVCMYICAYIV